MKINGLHAKQYGLVNFLFGTHEKYALEITSDYTEATMLSSFLSIKVTFHHDNVLM